MASLISFRSPYQADRVDKICADTRIHHAPDCVFRRIELNMGNPVALSLWTPHRDDGRRFIVRADEKLSAFVELERQVLTVTFYLESIPGGDQ
jgi:hypothetical protein